MFHILIKSQVLRQHTYQKARVLYEGARLYSSGLPKDKLDETIDPTEGHHDKSSNNLPKFPPSAQENEQDLSWMDKVLYSSYLERLMPPKSFRTVLRGRYEAKEAEKDELLLKTAISPPITLKYFMEMQNDEGNSEPGVKGKFSVDDREEMTDPKKSEESDDAQVQFPYRFVKKTEFTEECEGSNDDATQIKFDSVVDTLRAQHIDVKSLLDEQPSITDEFERAVEPAIVDPGTPDSTMPMSDVPCGGCGALLHCKDKSIPGYIASEIFRGAKTEDLRQRVCHRCNVLAAHQATLNVNVSADDYPRIVNKIRDTFAMVLLMIDLTDFPCSIWPGILDIIGHKRPVFLVGNKVDMLPQDSPDYLNRIEDHLIKCAVEIGMLEANILHTALISAKTGYGVEDLITTVFRVWKGRGDVFIMGCTNVGKSTLFNMFLKSDLCKPQAQDLVQSATISQWPGTTLNLLKFPMTSPRGWRSGLRNRRLSAERPAVRAEEMRRLMNFKETRDPELAVLTGYVGRTLSNSQDVREEKDIIRVADPFRLNVRNKRPPKDNLVQKKPGDWDPDNEAFTQGHWVYDTPGAVNPNQILDLLTLPELMHALPRTLIQPRTFFIKPNMSLFVGGLARVDYTAGPKPIRYTLFSNNSLPVTMCLTRDADEVYQKALGSKIFAVPSGSPERLAQFPSLKSKAVNFRGTGHGYSCADIVLSSVGWICVTAAKDQPLQLTVHTPDGKGIFIRNLALLPFVVNNKGKRIRGTYSYQPHKLYVPQGRVRNS